MVVVSGVLLQMGPPAPVSSPVIPRFHLRKTVLRLPMLSLLLPATEDPPTLRRVLHRAARSAAVQFGSVVVSHVDKPCLKLSVLLPNYPGFTELISGLRLQLHNLPLALCLCCRCLFQYPQEPRQRWRLRLHGTLYPGHCHGDR